MINENLEIRAMLSGASINPKCLYRACYLLSKWYKELGHTQIQTRGKIFEWANSHGYYINYDLNSIIYQAYKNQRRLTENIKVCISRGDITEINRRFDKPNSKLVALAILCYAKVFANSNKCFSISQSALSEWVQVNQGNLSSRIIPELINFEYIKKIQNHGKFTWNNVIKSKTLDLQICVDISNSGEFELDGNDIQKLFEQLL